MERLREWGIEFDEFPSVYGSLGEYENHNELPEGKACQESVTKYTNRPEICYKVKITRLKIK